jgi:peptidyl-prolyl cis-trans isomerase-like 3
MSTQCLAGARCCSRALRSSKTALAARIIHGWDTLDAMERVRVDEKDRPIVDIKIERVTIHANPIADKES